MKAPAVAGAKAHLTASGYPLPAGRNEGPGRRRGEGGATHTEALNALSTPQ